MLTDRQPSTLTLSLVGLIAFAAHVRAPAFAAEEAPSAVTIGARVKYGLGNWPDARGKHRACLQVQGPADAVRVHIPWRRRDHNLQQKQIIVVDAATEQSVQNVALININREFAELAFQPATVPGRYDVYYLPHKIQPGFGGYSGDYLPPQDTAQSEWLVRHQLTPDLLPQGDWRQLPEASVLEIQARHEFERFDPMEVIATADEMQQLVAAWPQPYLLFPEDRRHPIRMTDDLPLRWIENGPCTQFRGEAERNEYYAFQIGVFAIRSPVDALAIEFSDLRASGGNVISASALKCFNLGGIDWLGRPFQKTVNVPAGKVQALWCGVDVPRSAAPGEYRGTATIRPQNAPATQVELSLAISDRVLEDRGDGEPWRHSRLRWLDSTIGIDDEVTAPFTPLEVTDRTVRCLGREIDFQPTALPAQIRCGQQQLLRAPISFAVETAAGPQSYRAGECRITKQTPGSVVLESQGTLGTLAARSRVNVEFDGHLDFEIVVHASQATPVQDLRLEIPLRRDAAKYLMGIGRPGGIRPSEWSWKWGGPVYYDSFWIGDVHAGMQCELRGANYCGPMVNLYWPLGQLQPPVSWNNDGRGGCTLTETGDDTVQMRAYCGARDLQPGQELRFEFSLLITPVKPLDTAAHFQARYFHDYQPVDNAIRAGANVINIHHANELNPFINYPFLANERLSAYIDEAHAKQTKVKIYYTVRELTNHVTEIAALRSLGDEVFAPGAGGGYPWLREHLGENYTPAWYDHLPNGDVSAALVTSGASRWYNYYLEGLNWLLRNIEIDGLYLDDVTYDRQILKRMRKIMERARPGCLIDLHSNTGFSRGPANQYLEFFPYVDRLWFGESFNYNDPPDYWLTEISGIPYGLMGEMLQDGGNKWRGMLYGMTARMPWSGDPRPIWQAWDEFGIAQSRMIGYWEPNCPVVTNQPQVLATAYVLPGRTLISLASWAPEPVACQLTIDWKALGLDPAKARLRAPAIEGFQDAHQFAAGQVIRVEPARGWLLILE